MALLRLQSIPTITFPSPQPKFSKSSIALFNRRRLNPSHYHQLLKRSAVAEEISAAEVDQSVIDDEETLRQKETVSYDWSEEWYPLYLTKNVPDDAPLGLTVFDKQVVLFKDGAGELRCYEDRCPHRLAKLSEGQLFDGRLECLYHGWQFEGNGKCVKIPQLSEGAKIPSSACVRTYEIKDSQGVIWIWMSRKSPPNPAKIPWFENFERPGFRDLSTIHELPYDHSILLENLMDPSHVPISHNRSDSNAKREEAGPLYFEVTERTGRGFAGRWGRERDVSLPNHIPNFLRFEAPCVLQSNRQVIDKKGQKIYFTGLFLCRPSGQGKSMLIVRFGNTMKPSFVFKLLPQWFLHQTASKILEEDMGFLSSQNEILVREKSPTRELYINLKTSDTWVAEYRRWMDKVGHGMPYHFGHSTVSLPENPALVEHAPAGFTASLSASQPAKGGIGSMHAPNPANRYFRHVIHCKGCRNVVKLCRAWKKALSVAAAVSTALAILASGRMSRVLLLLSAAVFVAGIQICSSVIAMNTTNYIRSHRRL
ncbi:protein TIC 55, chloroplastic-like isoform X1 [Salvia hispanica]|uniref:protein TIC 55, chloroplastic-like isoform X1 n=1 Tax=Salvia hispanica TaxID=49212 RepID=UPI002008FA4A|nr:protein TIC 55, chloroplastic-like isoform X1 [Salvia hispanica]XP_047954036.1 protein TIC 55, chloroplastic-like isoform X1 [Salvia hispanica]